MAIRRIPEGMEDSHMDWPPITKAANLPVPELCQEPWPNCWPDGAVERLEGAMAVRDGDRLIIHRRVALADYGQLGTACGKTFLEMSLGNWQAR